MNIKCEHHIIFQCLLVLFDFNFCSIITTIKCIEMKSINMINKYGIVITIIELDQLNYKVNNLVYSCTTIDGAMLESLVLMTHKI